MDHWTLERMVKERQRALLAEAEVDRLRGGRPSLMESAQRLAATAGRFARTRLTRRTGDTFERLSAAMEET